MGTWRANKPDASNKINEVPELCQDNFDAIEDIIGVEHYTFTDGTLSGHHRATSIGTITIATASGDFPSTPPTGALAYGWGSMGSTYSGMLFHYTGSAWDRISEDQWSRVRAYPTNTITITGGAGSSAVTAAFGTESYDTLSEYNTSTGLFTALASGSYGIVASIGLSSAISTTNTVTIGLYKNGTLLESTQHELYESGGVTSTSMTAYPDAHPETTTVDGHVYAEAGSATGATWATIISAAGSASSDDNSSAYIEITSSSTTDTWFILSRGILLFDTSSIPDDATITSAILSLYGTSKKDELGILPNIDIYTSTPASNTSLTFTDYQQLGNTSQTGSPKTYTNWSTTGYNDFTFNATGRSNINKTGISKFGTRNANYDVSGSPPTWSYTFGNNVSVLHYASADYPIKPKLVVTYTTGTITPANQTVTFSSIVPLNAGDTLQIRVSKSTATDETDVILADETSSYLAIHRLSGVCL